MHVNADLNIRAVVDTTKVDWVPSPTVGIDRKMLDRDGGEVARATSLVRYAPNSTFPAHTHGGGEEFLVLDGVFTDEHGNYPAGTYVRNPPGSSHTPGSEPGCVIFVKLRQFDEEDLTHVVIDTNSADFESTELPGYHVLPLHEHKSERVMLARIDAGANIPGHVHAGGEEVFVLEGSLEDENGRYEKGTWLRSPSGSRHKPFSRDGCLLYVKFGHLDQGGG